LAVEPWKDRLISPLFVGLQKGLARLSLPANHRVGVALGHLLMLGGEIKRITQLNLHQAYPDLSPRQRHALLKAVLIETGKTATEMGIMWTWPAQQLQPLIRQVHGEVHMRSALARGKGVLLLAPHIGNWELLGWCLPQYAPTTSMYEPPYFPGIETFMRQGRERSGARLVPTNGRGVKALLDALRRNELVGLLPDQAPDTGYVFADFMGRPARTMTLAHKLVQKTDATVVMGAMIRRPRGEGYDLHFLPGPDLQVADPVLAAARLNRAVQDCVALAPAQYQWTYKRWRKGPKTLSDLYKKA